jgi:hypothetical protein
MEIAESSFVSGEHVDTTASGRENLDRARPRSVTILARISFLGAALGALTVLSGAFQFVANPARGLEMILGALLTALGCGALGLGFIRGIEWSRRCCLWAAPLLIAARFLMPGMEPVELAIEAAGYCACAVILMRPDVVEFFRYPERFANE